MLRFYDSVLDRSIGRFILFFYVPSILPAHFYIYEIYILLLLDIVVNNIIHLCKFVNL